MDRRDRRQCAGLVRARTETGLVAPARGGRIPGLPSRDHALLRGCRGRGGGPDRSGWRPAAAVGASGDGAHTALALGRHVRHRDRRESPVPRLAGILRFATVPALERAVVLRRLGRDRRSLLLGSAARGARLGRPAPLGTGARVPRHAPWRHDAGVVARPRPRRVRSEEHTSELQSPCNLVCRLLLEKKKKKNKYTITAYCYRASAMRTP